MNQKSRILSTFKAGNEYTAKQLQNYFQVGSPTKVISELRREGYAIYLNKRVDTKGRETMKYRLGTPSRRMVAVAVATAGASTFA